MAAVMAGGMTEAQVIRPNSYAQQAYLQSTAPIRVFSSRVGRGKTWTGVAGEHVKCAALPGLTSAVTRLERASMENTTLDALRKMIGPQLWDRGWKESKNCFLYPPVLCDDGITRQSRIYVFGWLDPGRALSAEFGSIFVDQAEQLEFKHYSVAMTRLRQNDPWINERAERLGLAARQMSLICNPEDNEHWIAREFDPESGMRVIRNAETGRVVAEVILSSFRDNTENLPDDYDANLENLKGTVYYDRLVLGKWARAEGLVFPMWEPSRHLVSVPDEWAAWGGYPPPEWPRYRGIDFGYRNPFVCLWVAENPATGVRHVYREWSMSEMLVEDHAKVIREVEAKELEALRSHASEDDAPRLRPYLNALHIRDSFADHDAEDAATLARHGVRTRPAAKSIDGCIKAISSALNSGKLVVVDNSLMREDRAQVMAKVPTSLARELSAYRWQKLSEKAANPVDGKREKPIDAMNHRIDALGYVLHSIEVRPRPAVWA